jgi:MFS family permease
MASGFLVSSMTRNLLHFYIGMGVLMGLGFAALPMSTHGIIVSNWFVRRRGMVMGLVASGMGVGVLAIVPLAQLLISQVGWRNAYRILALLLMIVIVPLNILFQRHRPEDVGLLPDGGIPSSAAGTAKPASSTANDETEWTLARALHSYRFWALAMGVFAGVMPLHMILIHQVAAAVDAGFSKELAATTLGLTGLFTSPGMILLGSTSDRIGREWAYTLGSLSMIVAITFLLYAQGSLQVWPLYAYAILFALGFASRQSLYPTIAADLFHGRHFGAINGALVGFIGAGNGMGPWLGGYLFDLYGNYTGAFWLANVLAFLSVVLIWIAGPGQVRHTAKRD